MKFSWVECKVQSSQVCKKQLSMSHFHLQLWTQRNIFANKEFDTIYSQSDIFGNFITLQSSDRLTVWGCFFRRYLKLASVGKLRLALACEGWGREAGACEVTAGAVCVWLTYSSHQPYAVFTTSASLLLQDFCTFSQQFSVLGLPTWMRHLWILLYLFVC